jgi:hypothetical protein
VAHLPAFTEPTDDSRPISTAVVRQQASGLNASGREPVEGPFQKVGGGLPPLVGKNLDVSDARVIVDADMDKLPADATDVGRAIAVDAVTDSSDTPQLLGVDVKKLPRRCMLVTYGRRARRLEIPWPRQPMTSEDPTDCRARNRAGSGDHHG